MTTTRVGHVLCAGTAAVAALLAGTASAYADPPGGHRIPVNNVPYDIPADACGFPVHVGVVDNREYVVKQSTNPDGSISIRVTGELILSITNTDTGASADVNASGPGSLTVYPDGSESLDAQGHFFTGLTADEQARFGMPGLVLSSGHLTASLDSTGYLTTFAVRGHVTDECPLIS